MTNSSVTVILLSSTDSSSHALLGINRESDNDTISFAYPSRWSFGSYADPSGIISLRLVTWGIVIPLLAVVGIATNALNVAVLACLTRRKSSPVFRILLAISSADILIMKCVLLDSLLFVERPDPVLSDDDVARVSDAWRTVHYSLISATNLFIFTSNWCTVAMATFRFIAVYFPMQASKWCTRRRATATVSAIITAAAILWGPPAALNALGSLSNTSTPDLPTEYYAAVSIASEFFPWTLCFILILLLLINFHKLSNNLSTMSPLCSQKSARLRRATMTLINTVVWFVATTAPYTITMFLTSVIEVSSDSSTPLSRLYCIGHILLLMNFNGNVFFYSMMSSSHRQKLKELLRITSPIQRRKT